MTVEDISRAADALFFAMRRARSAAAEQQGGLTLPQLTLLEPLLLDRELPVGRLAAVADVSIPTATRMLQQLERKAIVARQRSPEDERQVLIRLTEHGRRIVAGLLAQRRERQTAAFAAFTADEQSQLISLLRRLADLVAEPH